MQPVVPTGKERGSGLVIGRERGSEVRNISPGKENPLRPVPGRKKIETFEELLKATTERPFEARDIINNALATQSIFEQYFPSIEKMSQIADKFPELIGSLFSAQAQVLEAKIDYANAFKCYQKSAEHEYPRAMAALAMYYLEGRGVVQINKLESFRWLKKAADNGHDRSALNLAMMCETGDGVPRDYETARQVYQRILATNQSKDADKKSAAERLKNLPAPFPGQAEYIKGCNLEREGKYADALQSYLKAAQLGNGLASFKMGLLYLHGKTGVEKNVRMAFAKFHEGAQRGHVGSMYNYALMFELGEGVNPDKQQANIWYEKASQLGHKGAKEKLELKNSARSSKEKYIEEEPLRFWQIEPSRFPVLKNGEMFRLIQPSEKGLKIVTEALKQFPLDGEWELSKIEEIYNPNLELAFTARAGLLNGREGNPFFVFDWTKCDKHFLGDDALAKREASIAQRKAAINIFRNLAKPQQVSDLPHVTFFRGWHGVPDKATALSIAKTGYVVLGKTDPGFYGLGVYTTPFPEYALTSYAKGENEKVLILNDEVAFSILGITREDFVSKRLLGKTLETDCYTIPVVRMNPDNPKDKFLIPAENGQLLDAKGNQLFDYVENVVSEPSGCLPRFVVTFRKKEASGEIKLKKSPSTKPSH